MINPNRFQVSLTGHYVSGSIWSAFILPWTLQQPWLTT